MKLFFGLLFLSIAVGTFVTGGDYEIGAFFGGMSTMSLLYGIFDL